MTNDAAKQHLEGFRRQMAEYGMRFSADFPKMIVLGNLLIQVQWAEGLLMGDAEVSEEVLLNLGYIQGVLEQFDPRGMLSAQAVKLTT